MVGMGVGEDDAHQTFGVQSSFEKLLIGASGTIEGIMPFGLLKARAEDLAKVLSWVSLEMARRDAKNDDSLPAVDSTRET